MKAAVIISVLIIMLAGCAKKEDNLTDAMDLRQRLASEGGCSFLAEVTVDYGDRVYTFEMDCTSNAVSDVQFCVIKPESISGISGTISQNGGRLEFDDQVLLFDPLVQGQLTPVIAPWLMVKMISGGYIRAVRHEAEGNVLTIDDTFKGQTLMMCLTLQENYNPSYCEIFCDDRRILSLNIRDFHFK